MDEIFKLGKENDICIDVDSSHTLKMLNFIEKNNIKNVILFISIIKNGNELKDLKSIIDLINKKVEKPQVILVFNKVQVIEDVEFDFFNIFGYKALGVPGYENLDKYEKIYIPYHSIIDISSKFNSLVYDFADEKNIESSKREEEFYTNKLNSEQDEEKQEKLLEKMDTIIAKKKLIKKAIEFIDSMNSIVNKN